MDTHTFNDNGTEFGWSSTKKEMEMCGFNEKMLRDSSAKQQ
jgi:hypothetical protein